MRAVIEVQDEEEGKLIKAGLEDPVTRAVVKVMGALSGLPSDRARRRVMTLIHDKFDEDAGR